MDPASIEKAALELPPKERALLAEALLASLDGEAAQRIEASWAQVAEKRLEAFLRGEEPALDGPAVFKNLHSKLGQ